MDPNANQGGQMGGDQTGVATPGATVPPAATPDPMATPQEPTPAVGTPEPAMPTPEPQAPVGEQVPAPVDGTGTSGQPAA